jgi:hypothetical protein
MAMTGSASVKTRPADTAGEECVGARISTCQCSRHHVSFPVPAPPEMAAAPAEARIQHAMCERAFIRRPVPSLSLATVTLGSWLHLIYSASEPGLQGCASHRPVHREASIPKPCFARDRSEARAVVRTRQCESDRRSTSKGTAYVFFFVGQGAVERVHHVRGGKCAQAKDSPPTEPGIAGAASQASGLSVGCAGPTSCLPRPVPGRQRPPSSPSFPIQIRSLRDRT